uniref:Serpin domain-containing protein n=1 Tax=Heliothis virescens TaxID=7102 RepID=A0A2A4JZY5_HELVI
MAPTKHDADKENAHRTRIPLPKDPLPALPKHLLVDNKVNHKQPIVPLRCPLRTLNTQSQPKPGPSKVVPQKSKSSIKIDPKHVTLRQREDNLDWQYTVFRDKHVQKDASIITISDDEKDEKENLQCFVQNRKKSNLGTALSAVTPHLKANLESNRIRNIKRSLKRPHSRELQGLSPPAAAKSGQLDEKVKRRLQFNERLVDRLGTPDYWKRSYMKCLNRDYTVDVFEYLLAVECKPLDLPRTSSITRACVINWLMKVNGADGNPAIIQAACWYLDSILGTGHVQLDKLQLVAAACYWIAQKINGPYVPAARLVKYSNTAFTSAKLLAAEKAVLIRLRFPRQPVVAQDYITYLSWWCDSQSAGEIEVAATFLAMCGIMVDRHMCDEYPSVIAVAAVRNALLLLRKRELMGRLQSSIIFKAVEKKATNLSLTCSILRRAVRAVSAPIYEYKAPLEHYSAPPGCIAQRIITAANDLAVLDARNTEGRITICCLLLRVQSQDAFLSPYLNPDVIYFNDNIAKVAPLSVPTSGIRRVYNGQPNNKKQSTSVEIERSAELAYASTVEQETNGGDRQNIATRDVSASMIPSKEAAQQLAIERQNASLLKPYRPIDQTDNRPLVSERGRYWPEMLLTRPSMSIPQSVLDMSQRRPIMPQALKLQQNTLGVPNMSQAIHFESEISLGKPTVAIPSSEVNRPSETQGPSSPQASSANVSAKPSGYNSLLYSVTNFGVNLLKNIDAVNPDNVVVSPYSITTLLAMMQQGAWGKTQEQITNALRMTSESSASAYAQITGDIESRTSRNVLKVANNLFVAEAFIINQDFKKTAVSSFKSDITPLNFATPAAATQINRWVASKTDNKIERLISPDSLDSTTQMVLVNAIYFKGLWEVPFRVESTTPREFQLGNGQRKMAQFMRMRKMFKTGMDPSNNAKVILLPFEREEYYLMVILPSQFLGMKNTLDSLTDARLLSYLSFTTMDTELELPKFTARADTDLRDVLAKMGITNMFSRYAELNGVGSFRAFSPQISSAVHSAVLSIDEKGGSAAAATAFAAVALSYDNPAVVFKVNRPFIAVIWDTKTSLPLFMAKIEDPQQ